MIRSIRWRIQIGYAVFLLLAVVIAGCAVYAVWKREAERMLPLTVEVDTGRFLREFRPFAHGAPTGEKNFRPSNPEAFDPGQAYPYYYVIWNDKGEAVNASAYQPPGLVKPDYVATDNEPQHVQRQRDGFLENYEFSRNGRHCILVGRSTQSIESSLQQAAWIITLAGSAIVAAGLALGWWVAQNATRPLRQISLAAERIASGDLTQRINVRETETELGSLAIVLNDAFARLESAVEHEARFASDAAHELRTPVSVILAETQSVIEQQGRAGNVDPSILACRRAAQRMHALIESLLELARAENPRSPLDLGPCDLADLAADAQEIMRFIAGEKDITFTTELEPAPCEADSERLLQVALNLLANAVKFSPAGSKVILRTESDASFARLSIEDSGRGISDEHLPHIFERFYRADRSRTRATGGAGLGLAICKSLAEAHHGRLTVKSRTGEGSTFILHIPRSPTSDG